VTAHAAKKKKAMKIMSKIIARRKKTIQIQRMNKKQFFLKFSKIVKISM